MVPKIDSTKQDEFLRRRVAPLITPTGMKASKNIAGGMNGILADVFALYIKTNPFIGT
jgi:starvation-inducible DNA-binding protein